MYKYSLLHRYLFSYNKLIGGVLLTQERGLRESCGAERYVRRRIHVI